MSGFVKQGSFTRIIDAFEILLLQFLRHEFIDTDMNIEKLMALMAISAPKIQVSSIRKTLRIELLPIAEAYQQKNAYSEFYDMIKKFELSIDLRLDIFPDPADGPVVLDDRLAIDESLRRSDTYRQLPFMICQQSTPFTRFEPDLINLLRSSVPSELYNILCYSGDITVRDPHPRRRSDYFVNGRTYRKRSLNMGEGEVGLFATKELAQDSIVAYFGGYKRPRSGSNSDMCLHFGDYVIDPVDKFVVATYGFHSNGVHINAPPRRLSDINVRDGALAFRGRSLAVMNSHGVSPILDRYAIHTLRDIFVPPNTYINQTVTKEIDRTEVGHYVKIPILALRTIEAGEELFLLKKDPFDFRIRIIDTFFDRTRNPHNNYLSHYFPYTHDDHVYAWFEERRNDSGSSTDTDPGLREADE